MPGEMPQARRSNARWSLLSNNVHQFMSMPKHLCSDSWLRMEFVQGWKRFIVPEMPLPFMLLPLCWQMAEPVVYGYIHPIQQARQLMDWPWPGERARP